MTRADEIANEFEGSDSSAETVLEAAEAPATTADHATSENGLGPGAADDSPHQHRLELHRHVKQAAALEEVDEAQTSDDLKSAGATLGQQDDEATDAVADDAPGQHLDDLTDEVVESPRHESLPEIARHAAGAWLKAAGWTAGTSLRVGNELRKIAADPNSAQDVLEEVTKEVRDVARDFLGITELDAEVKEMAPLLSTGLLRTGVSSPEALRAQGEQLLREAADVGFDEGAHPAFARILTELSPDEARILRLLVIEGPEPMVDVRAHNLIGNGSQLIAQSLNMLGPKAGLRQRDRVPVYLTNLVRVNLIVLSEDPLESPVQYQVLEAQPEVLSVLHETVRARVIRRSVFLSPLGREFCDVCLPVHLPALPPPAADA